MARGDEVVRSWIKLLVCRRYHLGAVLLPAILHVSLAILLCMCHANVRMTTDGIASVGAWGWAPSVAKGPDGSVAAVSIAC